MYQHQHCLQVPHCTFFLLLYVVGNGDGDNCGGDDKYSDSSGDGDNDNDGNEDNDNGDLENLAQEKLSQPSLPPPLSAGGTEINCVASLASAQCTWPVGQPQVDTQG